MLKRARKLVEDRGTALLAEIKDLDSNFQCWKVSILNPIASHGDFDFKNGMSVDCPLGSVKFPYVKAFDVFSEMTGGQKEGEKAEISIILDTGAGYTCGPSRSDCSRADYRELYGKVNALQKPLQCEGVGRAQWVYW